MHIRNPLSWLSYKDFEQLETLKTAFDNLGDHAVITDTEGNVLYANRAAQEATGFSLEEMLGKNPADLWGGNMGQEFYETMWRTIKEEKMPFVGEMHNKRKDGVLYWQELHISPVLDKNSEIKFFIGVEPNITDRKEKEKFREEFVSILAHQLKNPLTSIRWALDALFGYGNLSSKNRETLQRAYNENTLLIDLVGDLLVVSRVKDAQGEVANFDLAQEIETIGERMRKANPKVHFRFIKRGEHFMVKGNRMLASQVFSNLITNAFEYADKQSPEVTLQVQQEDTGCVFFCENNGLSIPAEEQEKVFSKFFRASNATQNKERGTGLGLFIVKIICDMLGWSISFQSPRQEGDGALFSVHIPYVQPRK